MIRTITIDVLNLIILLLPPKKRQAKRVAWLQGLANQFHVNEQAFYGWRDEMTIRAMVTGETASLQWYLNHLYDPALQRILIIDSVDTGIYVSLNEPDGANPVVMGIDRITEPDAPYIVGLRGENSSSLPVDFRVLVPVGVNVTMVHATVKLYNMAHKSFDIQTF